MGKHILVPVGRFRFDLNDITIEPVQFLYMFANFLFFPTFQALIFNKVCLQTHDADFCSELQNNETFKENHTSENHDITAETSHWILKTNIALTAPSFFMVTLFLGPLGDKIGRKIPVLLPCIGALFSFIACLLNAKFMTASLYYLLVGPLVNGFFGGYIAAIMASFSYVGHVSSPESKMMRLGIIEAMSFLSGTIGVFVSGVMLDKQGFIFIFATLIVVISLAIIYTIVWVENIRSHIQDAENVGCSAFLVKFFKDSFSCVVRQRESRVFSSLVLLVISINMVMLCTTGDMDIALLYLKENLNFSQTLFGYFKGLDNFLRGITLITVLPLVKRFTSIRDLPLVLVGFISFAVNFVVLGVASTQWMVFLAAVLGMLKGVPSAGIRAMMSSMVSQDEQGRLFGIVAASESIITLIASVLFNELYPATVHIFPGLCYMLGAGLILLMFLLILYLHCTLPSDMPQMSYQTVVEDPQLQISDSDIPSSLTAEA